MGALRRRRPRCLGSARQQEAVAVVREAPPSERRTLRSPWLGSWAWSFGAPRQAVLLRPPKEDPEAHCYRLLLRHVVEAGQHCLQGQRHGYVQLLLHVSQGPAPQAMARCVAGQRAQGLLVAGWWRGRQPVDPAWPPLADLPSPHFHSRRPPWSSQLGPCVGTGHSPRAYHVLRQTQGCQAYHAIGHADRRLLLERRPQLVPQQRGNPVQLCLSLQQVEGGPCSRPQAR
mmetsp:Transcript_17796/g.41900  ORF Transcript_17796/g.41900 Transcript_17796/m.41900 type:complete len:229 (-) Transcript_17796:552-1238(-)